MRRTGRLAVVSLLAAALSGCGGGHHETTTPAPAPSETTVLRVYFLRSGKLQPVFRTVPRTQAVAAAALKAIGAGPTAAERRDLKLTSDVQGVARPVTISDGVARLPGSFRPRALAQLVYTLTQFPAVSAVVIAGARYTRADFESETPAILVESPLPFQTVVSPIHATGTANTFEATFQYDLVDAAGKVIQTHFVTATSGTGTRGTFDFTASYPAGRGGAGKLVVYELSAKDGTRIHVIAIPLTLE